MATASYEEYFSAPIQAITTPSPYRTTSRPAMATGCSAVTARAAVGCVMRDMADPLAACNVRIRDFYPQPRVVLSPQSTIFGSRGIMQIPERVLYIPEGEGSASLARLRRRRVGQIPARSLTSVTSRHLPGAPGRAGGRY